MNELKFELRINSPRWGREDTYEFTLTEEALEIRNQENMKTSKCLWVENRDPKWSAESLVKTLTNDSICSPYNINDLLEHAWLEWRNCNLNDEAVQEEIKAIWNWLSKITQQKPETEFWRKYF